jgi:hypothetical protein
MKQYKINDSEVLEWMKNQIELNKNYFKPNTGKIHSELHVGYLGMPTANPKNFWDNNLNMYKRLCDITYPFGEEIINCTIKFYKKNEYSSLHQDSLDFLNHSKKVEAAWTNSILIDQSPNISGGTMVICGDGWEPNYEQIKSRLITIDHKTPGDTVVWDDKAVHGVSKINSGHRICLVVIKERKLV